MAQHLRRLSDSIVRMPLASLHTLARSGAAMRVEGGETGGTVHHRAGDTHHTGEHLLLHDLA